MRPRLVSSLLAFAIAACLCHCSSAAPGKAADTAAPMDRSGVDTARPKIPAARHDTAPVAVVRAYYAAINSHDYDAAYGLWGQNGQASHQSRAQFAAGFAQTANVRITIADSVRIEGAAGSQYATIPVTTAATLRDGSVQRFAGTYTVRRAMVTGAPEADRRWHIYSAELHVVH
jgi:hypothetical protein